MTQVHLNHVTCMHAHVLFHASDLIRDLQLTTAVQLERIVHNIACKQSLSTARGRPDLEDP